MLAQNSLVKLKQVTEQQTPPQLCYFLREGRKKLPYGNLVPKKVLSERPTSGIADLFPCPITPFF